MSAPLAEGRINTRFVAIAAIALFVVLFNAGYVFHEPLMGAWLQQQEGEISRPAFIIPLIALAFAIYSVMLAYLYPIFRNYHARAPLMPMSIGFGILMGVIWDGLQGGIIEVATFKMPFVVFLVDSGYHVLVEGTMAGVILGLVARRWSPLVEARLHTPARV